MVFHKKQQPELPDAESSVRFSFEYSQDEVNRILDMNLDDDDAAGNLVVKQVIAGLLCSLEQFKAASAH